MTYYEEAQKRAKKRLMSPWTIPLRIISFALIIGIWALLVWCVWHFHLLWHPNQNLKDYKGIASILATVLPFFAAIPLGGILGNYLFRVLGPARKSLDQVANFKESQKELLKFCMWVGLPSIVISLIASLF